MKKLAYESQMSAVKFNDAGSTLGIVRQMLSAMRAQLRSEGTLGTEVTVSILVRTNHGDAEDQSDDRTAPASEQAH